MLAQLLNQPELVVATVLTFLLAGTVKGVIGLGLPTVCLAVMTVVADLPTAMALLLVPSFVTNFWQGVVGGHGVQLLKRLWPFFVFATLTVWAGARAFGAIDLDLLSALLGILLVAYALISLLGVRISVPSSRERIFGPVLGAVNGVFTGLTGSFVVPGVLYLQALGLSRDELIQAMGILFTVSTVALGFALRGNDLLSMDLGMLSLVGLLPALVGMVLGQRLRQRLSETMFRKVFLLSVLALGVYIVLVAIA